LGKALPFLLVPLGVPLDFSYLICLYKPSISPYAQLNAQFTSKAFADLAQSILSMLNPLENVFVQGTYIWSAARVILTHTLKYGCITRHPSISTNNDLLPYLFSCKGSIVFVGNKYGCFKYLCGMGH